MQNLAETVKPHQLRRLVVAALRVAMRTHPEYGAPQVLQVAQQMVVEILDSRVARLEHRLWHSLVTDAAEAAPEPALEPVRVLH